jgi:hypothetical protein
MFDGTLLRVWKYKDNIYISTHRKIDASNSRWGTSGKFVDLFKKYIESSFKLEDLFGAISAKSDSEDIQIHNFLLVDADLMICSKLPLDTKVKDGFVLYINSVNCTLPSEVFEKIPEVKYTEIADTTNTVIRVQSFKNIEEYNSYLNKGFYPDIDAVHPQISLGEGLILFNGKTMLKIVSKGYNRRAKIVNNDPNILHRVYEILTETQMSKDGMDNFLEKYSALPCPTDEQIEALKYSVISKFPEDWKTPSDQELTENTDRETREYRLRCAITHYALSLPVCYQKSALTCIKELINDRYTAINIVTNSYSKFEKQQYNDFNSLGHTSLDGTVNPRDLKVFERIRQIVIDAKNYANVRIKRGESIKGISGSQLFNKFTKDNIRNLMLKEYGTSLYKMVRVLVSDPKKKNE